VNLIKRKIFFPHLFTIRLVDEQSGRAITVESTQKGIQFYTGNFLDNVKGHNGATYKKHGALCLETQNYSDSVNNQVNMIISMDESISYMIFFFSRNFPVLFFVPVKNITSKQLFIFIWHN
jgi:galactose mutarotase-like enzyme